MRVEIDDHARDARGFAFFGDVTKYTKHARLFAKSDEAAFVLRIAQRFERVFDKIVRGLVFETLIFRWRDFSSSRVPKRSERSDTSISSSSRVKLRASRVTRTKLIARSLSVATETTSGHFARHVQGATERVRRSDSRALRYAATRSSASRIGKRQRNRAIRRVRKNRRKFRIAHEQRHDEANGIARFVGQFARTCGSHEAS